MGWDGGDNAYLNLVEFNSQTKKEEEEEMENETNVEEVEEPRTRNKPAWLANPPACQISLGQIATNGKRVRILRNEMDEKKDRARSL